jgi:hypothetical protein
MWVHTAGCNAPQKRLVGQLTLNIAGGKKLLWNMTPKSAIV